MTRYLVTVVQAITIPVEAADEDEARDLVYDFVDVENPDFRDCMDSTHYEVTDCEEVDPEIYHSTLGIDSKDPMRFHNLDEED